MKSPRAAKMHKTKMHKTKVPLILSLFGLLLVDSMTDASDLKCQVGMSMQSPENRRENTLAVCADSCQKRNKRCGHTLYSY